jgi:hypothetical protein
VLSIANSWRTGARVIVRKKNPYLQHRWAVEVPQTGEGMSITPPASGFMAFVLQVVLYERMTTITVRLL